jgi:hypothetical protein
VLDETDETEIIKVIAKSISLNEGRKFNVLEELEETNYELDKQNEKLKKSKKEIDFYDVKEKINNRFYKMNAEEQRNELVKITTKCVTFSYCPLIEAGRAAISTGSITVLPASGPWGRPHPAAPEERKIRHGREWYGYMAVSSTGSITGPPRPVAPRWAAALTRKPPPPGLTIRGGDKRPSAR